MPAPTTASLPIPASAATPRPFLSDATVRHGPRDLIANYLLSAVEETARRGVQLSLGTFEDLVAVNAANRASWAAISPAFNPECQHLAPENAYCIFGRNSAGEIVATQAARLYEWPQTSFYDETVSMRLFYAEPERMRAEGEGVTISAKATHHISGLVAYSGAGWYRPDYRGGLLSNLIPRISRAYTLALWGVDFTTAILHETVVAKKLIARSGHRNVDWEIRTTNFRAGSGRCAFVWMTAGEIADDLDQHLGDLRAQVDAAVLKRSA